MVNNISSLIPSQIPEYLRESAPLFVGFLETYYKYAQRRTGAIGLVQGMSLDFDIDETLDKYVSEFYAVYGQYLPTNIAMDKRNFIKILNSVYDSKGSEKSFKLLFRALFNVEVDLYNPSEQILRASDGKWYQESFITLYRQYGDYTKLYDVDIPVYNSFGAFSFRTTRIDDIGDSLIRVYFSASSPIKFEIDKNIDMYQNGSVTFRGIVKDTPSTIRILDQGANFQVGQIYNISGTTIPTTFKIKTVSSGGLIESVEILNFGYTHAQSQQSFISSYKSIPPNTGSSIVSTETSPGVFRHDISIADTIYDIIETVSGLSVSANSASYFLQDYVDISYSGAQVILQYLGGTSLPPSSNGGYSSITLQQYLEDRARVELLQGDVSKLPGRYLDNKGHISDQTIKMQDNYYYQIFSYVIKSEIDVSVYKSSILNILHPAGIKSFSSLQKVTDVDVSASITVDEKKIIRLNFNDVALVSDNFGKTQY